MAVTPQISTILKERERQIMEEASLMTQELVRKELALFEFELF